MKSYAAIVHANSRRSPPARGAWIEMQPHHITHPEASSRPPRGGRGLKCPMARRPSEGAKVAPREGGVD